jgi:hypothetical protein
MNSDQNITKAIKEAKWNGGFKGAVIATVVTAVGLGALFANYTPYKTDLNNDNHLDLIVPTSKGRDVYINQGNDRFIKYDSNTSAY